MATHMALTSLFVVIISTLRGFAIGQAEVARDQTLQECFGKEADIFFLLDSSSSIYIEDYYKVLQLVSEVVTRLDISRVETRVGALTFSDDFQIGFELERFRTKGDILVAVTERHLPYRTGVTNTDTAIRYVRNNPSFRSDVTKVIIVVTDGGSRSQESTAHEAELAREAGFYVVVVGLGLYIDEQEWKVMANDPDSEFIFNVSNIRNIGNLRDSLPRKLCQLPPVILSQDCRVSRATDLLFLSATNNPALDALEELSEMFVNKELLNVQYIIEACEDTLDKGFQGPNIYCNRFGSVMGTDEDTFVGLLTRLRTIAKDLEEELGRDAKQIAVIFIDHKSMQLNRFGILQETRNAARMDGIEIIVVDLGVRQYRNFVTALTQNQQNVINFFGERRGLPEVTQDLRDRICNAINVPGEIST